jgi:hypothetical protein
VRSDYAVIGAVLVLTVVGCWLSTRIERRADAGEELARRRALWNEHEARMERWARQFYEEGR